MKKTINNKLSGLNPGQVLIMVTMAFFMTSCKKESSCYDEQLYEQYKDKGCTTDCPGVIGCDGKTYCNECEANRRGIRIK